MTAYKNTKSTSKKSDGYVRLYQFLDEKKYILGSIVFIGLFIVFMFNSFAALEPVSSITVKSTTLDYSKSEEGSWKYTKSAKWISKGKARINIKLETIEKPRAEYTDVILVLDTSGSMVKDKIDQLQKDVNELINDTIPKGNKIALISFNDTATIVNDFTDDAVVLQESINNLTTSGETNYYQALLKVDDILSTYNKESNRDCVVLFLTDGLPTSETPSEVGEYKLLKDKYDYLSINGIQYELGEKILEGIKNITDIQFIASTKTLNEFLYKASISPASYDNFVLTDYVDADNFNLKDVSNISTTFGSASIEDNQVIWNLDGFKTGLDAELTIDINLNDDLIGIGGVYPTHTKTDLSYKIGTISTVETTDKTTVLKDNYVVSYEPNTPTGCVVSWVPSSKVYSVFDTVRLDDSVPTCNGYQFKEWKIETDNVEKIGNNQFIMPESNVTIRAIWKKVGLVKSTDGKISNAQSLYKYIASNTIGLDTNIDFSESATDADSGIYTSKETESDKYPIYYYRGNIDNNNVLFAGFCWKIVRTTSTGGVKLIYNGSPSSDYNVLAAVSSESYINISNDATYPYTYDTSTNKWTSTNKTDSATGTISFSISESGTYILSYSVSSEKNYDKAYFYRNGNQIGVYSGTESGTIILENLVSDDVIMVKYTKDGSSSSGSDTVSFSINETDDTKVTSCNNTGTSSLIGTTNFNLYSTIMDVGYMYGTRYSTRAYSYNSDKNILERNFLTSSTKYYYSKTFSYSSTDNNYTLIDAEQKTWSDSYNDAVGYYACGNLTCSKLYYITGATSSYQFNLTLSDGATDINDQVLVLSKSINANTDGTYTLSEPITVLKKDWYTNYDMYKRYYACEDLTSTTCTKMNVIVSTSTYTLSFDKSLNFVYGNDVSWDGEKYILKDTVVSKNGWSSDNYSLSKKYHYTCFNDTGECSSVYYITYFGVNYNRIYSLILNDGKNIDDAKREMFSNDTASAAKKYIDSWYEKNLISYTAKLEDTIWCNDRTISLGPLVGKDSDFYYTYTFFGAYNRLEKLKKPTFNCPLAENDGFSISTSSGGNGSLTYPVGLLTADEVQYAGQYLATGEFWWTMTPRGYDFLGSDMYEVEGDGSLFYASSASTPINFRPAVSLVPGIRYFDGDGTVNNPFVIGDE